MPRSATFFIPLFLLLSPLFFAAEAQAADEEALLRIELRGALEDLGLPIHAHLRGADGTEYVLVRATPARVQSLGIEYIVLDPASSVDTEYLIALERRPGARERVAENFDTILDDGRRVLVRAGSERAEELQDLGFQLSHLPTEPLKIDSTAGVFQKRSIPKIQALTPSDEVAEMVAAVRKAFVFRYNGMLSGEEEMRVGGADFLIGTRSTDSGAPIETATQFVYEHLLAQGLDASYHDWQNQGLSGRNVVGELRGTTQPEEIVLITAHLDSRPFTGAAPGADDNGSGSTAVMLAAEILAEREFARTVRFIFFTGEEQGLLGSRVYAQEAAEADEILVATLNLDMISWNSDGDPKLRLHTRLESNPGFADDLRIADVFIDVVNTYGLETSLEPILDADGITASDHSPFWTQGYPALLAIEDDVDDFNPNWHRTTDLRNSLDLDYFTAFVRAGVGTIAHLAVPAGSPGVALKRPNQMRGMLVSSTQVELLWNDRSDNESSFQIDARQAGSSWQDVARVAAGTQRTVVTGLSPDTTYEFRARARWADSASGWSNRAIVSTSALTLLRPNGLRAEGTDEGQIQLLWNDRSEGETSFEIDLRTPSQTWTRVLSVDANTAQAMLSLSPGSYSFRVRARAGETASGWSNRADFVLGSTP